MSNYACDGFVRTLRGETVLFTGVAHVHGEQMVRKDCKKWVREHGGTPSDDFAQKVTVLVHGNLSGSNVIDPIRQWGQKLFRVEASMASGRKHVHVIDDVGFELITDGKDAPCLRLR